MELKEARTLICGATGVLGGQLAVALDAEGAQVALAGRNESRLKELSATLDDAPTFVLDAVDQDSCDQAVDDAAAALGGLDLLVVTVGVAAFGPAMEADPAVTEELFAVNTLGPMGLVRAAGPHLSDSGTVVVLSAILADVPTAQMAEYSASKSALATWLQVLQREQRRRLTVIDVRPPHLDTELDTRAIAGTPPRLPEPYPAADVVDAVLRAIREDAKAVTYDGEAKALRVN